MANKGLAALDDFAAGVLSKITDPDQKRKAEEAIAALKTISPVAQAFGDGVAGQSEIDRTLQTLTAQRDELAALKTDLDDRDARLSVWHGELTNWYAENKTLVEQAKAGVVKPNGSGGKDGTNGGDKVGLPAGVLTEDGYNERIQTERAGFLGFQRDQNQLTREHFAKFGEIVDLEPLLKHPQIGQVGLLGVYAQVHKDRLTTWQADAEKKRDDAIRLDERQKVQAAQTSMPYPSPTGAGSGSPLDALSVGKGDALVDQATAHYNRLQQERTAAP